MKKGLYIIITIFMLNIGVSNVKALSAYVSRTSVTVGSSVVVTIDAKGGAGNFSVTSSNGNVLSGGTNSTWIDDQAITYSFVANSPGTAVITVSGTAASYSSGNDENLNRSFTISVGAKPTVNLSKDNTLSSLSIDGYELTPKFSKDTLEYSVELKPDTTKIKINAKANHSGATVSGIGDINVNDGKNKLEVVVTAENGSTKIYTITANVKEYDPIKVKVNGKEYTVIRKKTALKTLDGYKETTVKIDGNEVPALKSKTTGYTLVGLKDEKGKQNYYIKDKDKYTLYVEYKIGQSRIYPLDWKDTKIPSGFREYKMQYGKDTLKVYKTSSSSKYSLIYALNVDTGEKNLYMYDAKEDTLQIYNKELLEKYEEENHLYLKVALASAILSFVLFITLIIVIVKSGKNKVKVKQINNSSNRTNAYNYRELNDDTLTSNKNGNTSVLSIIGIVLGVIALITSFIPIINNGSFVVGLIGFIFSIVGIFKSRKKTISIISIILCLISMIIVLSLQSQWSKDLNKISDDFNKDMSNMSGKNTDEILNKYADVKIGQFVFTSDEYGLNDTKLDVTLTNKTKKRKSFSIEVEALDSDGNRIDTDTIYFNNIDSNQTVSENAFTLITSEKIESMKNAKFKVIAASMY